MIVFAFVLISVLTFCVLFFFIENKKIQKEHQLELGRLNALISDLRAIQIGQQQALKLSDDLKLKLETSRIEIDQKMLNLQMISELFCEAASNK